MGDEKRLPCGWRFKLPRFCEGRKCETCVMNKTERVKEKESEVQADGLQAVPGEEALLG